MPRTKGAVDLGVRSAPKTPYETYSEWYDTYTKGDKKGWFEPKLNKTDFAEAYERARLAKVPNPARSVAMSQEYVDRTFERRYKREFGKKMGDISTKEARENLFRDYAKQKMGIDLNQIDNDPSLTPAQKKAIYKKAKGGFEDAFY